MITKVQKLTGNNIWALDNVSLGEHRGSTFVEFEGSPSEALVAVEKAMRSRGVDAVYRSLAAVRRKLSAAKTAYSRLKVAELLLATTQVTPYVQVKREASDGTVEVTI